MIRNVSMLKVQTKTIQESLDTLLQRRKDNLNLTTVPAGPHEQTGRDLFILPVDSLEKWTLMEEKVNEQTFRQWLVSFVEIPLLWALKRVIFPLFCQKLIFKSFLQIAKLSRRGGNNVGDCARRVMSALMTDKFAIGFSWKGLRNGKAGFQSSKLMQIVYGIKIIDS